MELEDEEEDDDFHALTPEYDDAEMFSHDDHSARRKQTPLSKRKFVCVFEIVIEGL